MAILRPTLDLSQIQHFTHPMFIPTFYHLGVNPKVPGILSRRLDSIVCPFPQMFLNTRIIDKTLQQIGISCIQTEKICKYV